MINKLKRNQAGAAHMLIVIIVVVLVIGGAGYLVFSRQKDSAKNAAQSAASKEIEAECKKEIDDKDFCKFASNVNFDTSYKTVMTSASPEGTFVINAESDDKGNSKSTTLINGKEMSSFVTIGSTSYTKDLADGSWTKYTSQTEDEESLTDDVEFTWDDETTTEDDNIEYKKIGKEACGKLDCFKYQIIDPDDTSTEQFIWFDDEDYLLRRMTFKDANGSGDITYEYTSVVITEPSPIKEMPTYDTNNEDLEAQLEAAMSQFETE